MNVPLSTSRELFLSYTEVVQVGVMFFFFSLIRGWSFALGVFFRDTWSGIVAVALIETCVRVFFLCVCVCFFDVGPALRPLTFVLKELSQAHIIIV